jgi:hypothetical protein
MRPSSLKTTRPCALNPAPLRQQGLAPLNIEASLPSNKEAYLPEARRPPSLKTTRPGYLKDVGIEAFFVHLITLVHSLIHLIASQTGSLVHLITTRMPCLTVS